MRRALIIGAGTVGLLAFVALAQEKAAPSPQPTTQPATSRPALPSALRTPEQAEVIRKLLEENVGTILVPPREDVEGTTSAPAGRGSDLLAEGRILSERPGRYIREDGKPKFVFLAERERYEERTMELLPNQLLELMESEASHGVTDFVVTGQVTLYREKNYLILLKVVHRIDNGNLSP